MTETKRKLLLNINFLIIRNTQVHTICTTAHMKIFLCSSHALCIHECGLQDNSKNTGGISTMPYLCKERISFREWALSSFSLVAALRDLWFGTNQNLWASADSSSKYLKAMWILRNTIKYNVIWLCYMLPNKQTKNNWSQWRLILFGSTKFFISWLLFFIILSSLRDSFFLKGVLTKCSKVQQKSFLKTMHKSFLKWNKILIFNHTHIRHNSKYMSINSLIPHNPMKYLSL